MTRRVELENIKKFTHGSCVLPAPVLSTPATASAVKFKACLNRQGRGRAAERAEVGD